MLATLLRAVGAGKLGTSGRMTRTGEHLVPFHLSMNSLLVFLNVHKIIRKRTEDTIVALHPEVFRVS